MDSLLNAAPRVGLVRDHKHRANLMRWVQFAIVSPCLVVSAHAQATDKRTELANGGVMTGVCLFEKCAGVRPIVVGAVEPALFEEGERGIKGGAKAIGRNAEPGPVLTGNAEKVRHKQGGGGASDGKQPQINGRENETEDIHPGFKALIIGAMVAAFISLFSTPENTMLTLQKPNAMKGAKHPHTIPRCSLSFQKKCRNLSCNQKLP